MSHGWASVRTSSTLGRYSSAIRAACANERSCGSARGAISNGRPYRDLKTPSPQRHALRLGPTDGASLRKRLWVLNGDFERVLAHAQRGDFVYMDQIHPLPCEPQRVFREYDPSTFTLKDIKRLRAWMERLPDTESVA